MDLGLTDTVFIVTAASSGLGRASADALLAEGARVLVVARREDALAAYQAEHGPARVAILPADLSASDTGERAAALAVETFGRLDGALVSVGGPARGGVLDNTDEQWSEAFDSVFLAALRVARAVVAKGTEPVRLGFVLSTSAKTPLPSMAISNGLRPGLAVLVKQLADELGPRGRTFGLMPGSIATERLQYLYSQTPDPDAARAEAVTKIPAGRLGDPAEFGRVAAFLLSEAASYISGCLIPVDGGAMRAL